MTRDRWEDAREREERKDSMASFRIGRKRYKINKFLLQTYVLTGIAAAALAVGYGVKHEQLNKYFREHRGNLKQENMKVIDVFDTYVVGGHDGRGEKAVKKLIKIKEAEEAEKR